MAEEPANIPETNTVQKSNAPVLPDEQRPQENAGEDADDQRPGEVLDLAPASPQTNKDLRLQERSSGGGCRV